MRCWNSVLGEKGLRGGRRQMGVGGLKQDMLGITQSTKKVSHDLKHRVDLFGFRKNLLHVVWRRECFPSLLAVCSDTTHGNIFGEAMGLRRKKREEEKKKERSRHFISSPSFHSSLGPLYFFKPIEFHSVHLLATCGNISLMNIHPAPGDCDM